MQALCLVACCRGPERFGDIIGQLDDLERAGALFHAAQEAALLQRSDQAMNARFRFEVERVLHLVERGRNARFAHPLVDEHQKFVLLAGQHAMFLSLRLIPWGPSRREAPANKAETWRIVLL